MSKVNRLTLIYLFLISGCSMSPGIQFTENHFDKQHVPLIPITPKTIKMQYTIASDVIISSNKGSTNKRVTYKVGPQDVLNIIVWEHPELTIPTGGQRSAQEDGSRVSDDGTIFYPYVGVVNVANKTTEEIRSLLTRKLSTYIKRPQVDVRVVQFNSQKVLVSGAVENPGNLPITDIPMTLADAVNHVGGPLETADLQDVVVNRKNSKIHINLFNYYDKGDAEQNFLLQDGDVIYVPINTDKKVYLMGEVKNPGVVPLINGKLNLAEVLAAGGIDQVAADPKRIFVLRNESGKPMAYHLDAANPSALILASQFNMEPLDIVFVSTADIALWNRTLTKLLGLSIRTGKVTTTLP